MQRQDNDRQLPPTEQVWNERFIGASSVTLRYSQQLVRDRRMRACCQHQSVTYSLQVAGGVDGVDDADVVLPPAVGEALADPSRVAPLAARVHHHNRRVTSTSQQQMNACTRPQQCMQERLNIHTLAERHA